MGKTDKEKAKEKEKSKLKDSKRDKVPKALKPSGGDAKKKKWSKSKKKDKLNNQVFWTKNLHDKLIRDVIGKSEYVTPSIISEKLKVNVSLAREALKELRETEQVIPSMEYHSKYCCYIKGPKYVAPAEDKKKEAPAKGEKATKADQKKK